VKKNGTEQFVVCCVFFVSRSVVWRWWRSQRQQFWILTHSQCSSVMQWKCWNGVLHCINASFYPSRHFASNIFARSAVPYITVYRFSACSLLSIPVNWTLCTWCKKMLNEIGIFCQFTFLHCPHYPNFWEIKQKICHMVVTMCAVFQNMLMWVDMMISVVTANWGWLTVLCEQRSQRISNICHFLLPVYLLSFV